MCPSVDDEIKKRKLVDTVEKCIMASSSAKKRSVLSLAENNICVKSVDDEKRWLENFKVTLGRASSRQEKIVLLTTIPFKLLIRKAVRELGVSKRMLLMATNLKNDKNYSFDPKRKDRLLSPEIIKQVNEFFFKTM